MRIARAPLRITLGGGGTDLPGYYEKYGGFLISASINKYIYMTCSRRPFDKKFWLSYSMLEVCESVAGIKHELFQKSLEKFKFDTGLELHSISEVPGNSGLGSSGSFLVCLLTLLNSLDKKEVSRQDVAELASRIEMEELKHACGKQDQYIAAFGGIISLDIAKDGSVKVENLKIPIETVRRLEGSLLIFHTGISRQADSILKEQTKNLKSEKKDAVNGLMKIKEIGLASRDCLLKGDLDAFGKLLHDHWTIKKAMTTDMTNPQIDGVYDMAMKAGALGGKVMGAGGGGFFMFHVPLDRQGPFRAKMKEAGLLELNWRFSFHGCEVVFAN